MTIRQIFTASCAAIISFSCALTSVQAESVIIPKPPVLNATAYVLMDAASGEILVQKNADKQLPPASMTKMMTSYLATHELALGNLGEQDQVPVSIKAWKMGGSKMFIREGRNVALIDLIKGIIIQSGNDASIAVSEYVAGSEDAFVDLMNKHAQRMGMVNTQFQNATGWPAKGHFSSAHDMAVLAQAIVNDHPEYYSLYKEKYFEFNKIRQPNRNKLLWRDPSVDGLKTGHTEEAGFCLTASAQRNGMRLIAVVMGTKSENARATETQKLLTYGFRYFETHRLYKAGESIKTLPVWYGEEIQFEVGLTDDLYITVARGAKEQLQLETLTNEFIEAPLSTGEDQGSLTIRLNDKIIAERPLVVLTNVTEAGFFSRLWDGIKLFFIKLIGGEG
ncbi:MAG: D-alanyl-D-alanine carboxypeptidase [Oleispira sp.]|nr:D-alanyl-D-alanine carboxypeptidase [Oleispira sp.]MBL4798325.1 D-alanyl-D-alanine carboxypeptidase [Oleispira sp.]MBL4881081.1 D-alanyl-D-alanine carboxypeptidase [Oleispira sp.]